MQTFFAEIPSGIQIPHLERYYQTILYILAKVLDLTVQVEVMTNMGRIDMTIETSGAMDVLEFKTHGSAQEALDQIEEKILRKISLTWKKDYFGRDSIRYKKTKSWRLDN